MAIFTQPTCDNNYVTFRPYVLMTSEVRMVLLMRTKFW